MKLLSIFGTRPEAVKMAPILIALEREPGIESQVCVTGQHRLLLDQVLDFFSIRPDFDLNLMEPGQSLNALVPRAIERLDPILAAAAPDRVIVQGDTSTALAAALAAFHRGIPVAHVEAGLRTYCAGRPSPRRPTGARSPCSPTCISRRPQPPSDESRRRAAARRRST